MPTIRFAALLAALVVAAAPGAPAADWPQWGGPDRDFTLPGTTLPPTFGPGGPALRWTRPIGDGFSAVVTRGNHGFTVYREGDRDVALAFDLSTGETVWEHRSEAPFVERCSQRIGPAPRATPLVAGDRLFTASAGGHLLALDRATGSELWRTDLFAEAPEHVKPCGYSSSPLAHGDHIIVLTGVPGRSIAALRQSDGAAVWQRHDFSIGYSSPLVATLGGRTQIVALMGAEVVALAPDTGDLLWQHPHPTLSQVNVSMPVVGDDGLVLISSAYDGGSRVIRVGAANGRPQVDEVWSHQRLRVHFGSIVRIGDMAIGASGDTAVALLTAVDVPTGRLLWRSRAASNASLIAAGGRLLILDEDGDLLLATPDRIGLTVDDRAAVLKGTSWTPPTLAGRTVLVRNRTTLAAYELPATDSAVAGMRPTDPVARTSPRPAGR